MTHVLIIGAGSVLGEAIATIMCTLQQSVIWLAGERPELVEKSVNKIPGPVEGIILDVTDINSCRRALGKVTKAASFIGIVNCAGIGGKTPLLEYELSDWQKIIDVNLLGAVNVISVAGEIIHRGKIKGSFVNISSLNSYLPAPGFGAYCVSKAALSMLTQVAALELAPLVRVNAIAPGPIERPSKFFSAFPAFLDNLRQQHILDKRLAQPDEIGEVAKFLICEQSSWITGQTITVDGGVGLNFGESPDYLSSPSFLEE